MGWCVDAHAPSMLLEDFDEACDKLMVGGIWLGGLADEEVNILAAGEADERVIRELCLACEVDGEGMLGVEVDERGERRGNMLFLDAGDEDGIMRAVHGFFEEAGEAERVEPARVELDAIRRVGAWRNADGSLTAREAWRGLGWCGWWLAELVVFLAADATMAELEDAFFFEPVEMIPEAFPLAWRGEAEFCLDAARAEGLGEAADDLHDLLPEVYHALGVVLTVFNHTADANGKVESRVGKGIFARRVWLIVFHVEKACGTVGLSRMNAP